MDSVAKWLKDALTSVSNTDPTGTAGLLGELGMTFEWRVNAGSTVVKARLTQLGDRLVAATAAAVGTRDLADRWRLDLTRIINEWVQSTTSITHLSPRAPVLT
jgi:hypothetical protein